MTTPFPVDCRQATLAGAKMLTCPARLIRGRETDLISAALPFVETRGVMLDMSAVKTMDAAGVGCLMTLRQVAERAGTFLVLINPSRRACEVLRLFGLDAVLLCKTA